MTELKFLQLAFTKISQDVLPLVIEAKADAETRAKFYKICEDFTLAGIKGDVDEMKTQTAHLLDLFNLFN